MSFRKVCLLPLVLASLSASAQLQPGPRPANPLATAGMTPEKLRSFALAHNGLGEVIGQPWHIKVSFEVSAGPGSAKFLPGSYEETYYAPQNYRRTFTFKGITHTDTSTPDGLFRSGDQAWPTPAEIAVRQLLVKPLPSTPVPAGTELQVKDTTIGKLTLPCLYEVETARLVGLYKKDAEAIVDRSPHACFDTQAPILRFAAGLHHQDIATFSKVINLHGHLVPQEVEVLGGPDHEPVLRIHVTEVTAIPPPTGPMTAESGATQLKPPFNIPAELLEPIPGRMHQPVYPAGALQEHLEGDVNLAVVIGPDGLVKSATIVNGIQMLRDSAREFVLQEQFQPFLIGGVPSEVHTTLTINFNVGMAMRQVRN